MSSRLCFFLLRAALANVERRSATCGKNAVVFETSDRSNRRFSAVLMTCTTNRQSARTIETPHYFLLVTNRKVITQKKLLGK